MSSVDCAALEVLFKNARSQNGWGPEPVAEHELRAAFEIAKWGPTSMNTQPMRIVFLRTAEAKERLKPALASTNVPKADAAPVVALMAYDSKFHDHLPRIFPHKLSAQSLFVGNESLAESTAFRNGTLQAAYFMIALRAVGLDIGPMSGFDPGKVNSAFFADTSLRINFICAIGHGDSSKIFPRLPRFEFDEIASFL